MKQKLLFLPLFFTIFLLASCGSDSIENQINRTNSYSADGHLSESGSEMSNNQNINKLEINQQPFSIQYEDNPTAADFQNFLPLGLRMTDHNQNEKFADLPDTLPTNTQRVQQIQAGDVMLYGNQTIVVFYEDFSTSYAYTRIGRIENTEELTEILRTENTVEFQWSN